ncbi:hypothetical protein D4740_07850 [Actinomyces sp. 2119]|uniref:hypothetical protein n=1 Tax=Actinomyces sp. 2119 TaxID=2321393 RepID=UPI000E6C62CD|nr:hypothetical protein [Actinomyces sp. 2119]RJF41962.1 hypothetical protein D4740_07850 [Actinomyces sp. 2119]
MAYIYLFISQSAIDTRTQAAVSAAQVEEDVVAASLGGLSTGLSSIPHPVTQATGVAISLASPVMTEEVGAVDLSGEDYATGHEWMSAHHTIDTASVLTSTEHSRQLQKWLEDASIPEVTLENALAAGVQDGQHSASH